LNTTIARLQTLALAATPFGFFPLYHVTPERAGSSVRARMPVCHLQRPQRLFRAADSSRSPVELSFSAPLTDSFFPSDDVGFLLRNLPSASSVGQLPDQTIYAKSERRNARALRPPDASFLGKARHTVLFHTGFCAVSSFPLLCVWRPRLTVFLTSTLRGSLIPVPRSLGVFP